MRSLKEELSSLTVFRNILSLPVSRAFTEYLSAESAEKTDKYSEFVFRLYSAGYFSLGEYVRDALFSDDNVFVRLKGKGEEVPAAVKNSVERELSVLSSFAAYPPEKGLAGYDGFDGDLAKEYLARAENISRYGYGIYAKYGAFCFDGENIVPVEKPDGIRLSDLFGYGRERRAVTENTRALLSGKPAANVLLTGDAGTGKSSTVKAIANEFFSEGLRIVEITKEQLKFLPAVFGKLADNPLKFIVFIDDLSFGGGEDNFSSLKAALEGSVSAKAKNAVIYATSNRRHIVKETFSDREGDDVHRNDTMQELVSLSDRFGLRVTFQKPDKKAYLQIVRSLAEKEGVRLPAEELDLGAERFALEKGGRTPRAAAQYINKVVSES